MFTGIIQKKGHLVSRSLQGKQGVLVIRPDTPFENPTLGESIAVNGVCLTLSEIRQEQLVFDTLAQTLSKTNLGILPIGAMLNLERAIALSERFGGHFVQGHVDAAATIHAIGKTEDDFVITLALPDAIQGIIIPTGSVTLDGISLTVTEVTADTFSVHIIPTTLRDTALATKKAGDTVNIEGDILGKYIFHLTRSKTKSDVTMETLFKAGF